jgi:hypothetical protein
MTRLTAAQICARARGQAKVPGWAEASGQCFNVVLDELGQTYDFEIARKTHWFNFDTGAVAIQGTSIYGSGPNNLPSDFLRMADALSATYNIGDGVARRLVPCDITEFDQLVQQAGNASYPCILAIDLSTADAEAQGTTPGVAQAYVWPPPSGSFAAQFRYYPSGLQIDTPETSDTIPWFPLQSYLITRTAGELMKESGDDRMAAFLGDGPEGAQGLLDRYLKNKDNQSNRPKRVTLDQRSFGGANFSRLPNTKALGW